MKLSASSSVEGMSSNVCVCSKKKKKKKKVHLVVVIRTFQYRQYWESVCAYELYCSYGCYISFVLF